jgi:hypothetical protein
MSTNHFSTTKFLLSLDIFYSLKIDLNMSQSVTSELVLIRAATMLEGPTELKSLEYKSYRPSITWKCNTPTVVLQSEKFLRKHRNISFFM